MKNSEIAEVFNFLRPNGGWIISGENIADAVYEDNIEPISQDEFNAGVIAYQKHLADVTSKLAADKSALLQKLGITEDEAKLLLG